MFQCSLHTLNLEPRNFSINLTSPRKRIIWIIFSKLFAATFSCTTNMVLWIQAYKYRKRMLWRRKVPLQSSENDPFSYNHTEQADITVNLRTSFREVSCSNLGRTPAKLTKVPCDIPQSLQTNFRIVFSRGNDCIRPYIFDTEKCD